MNFETQLFQTYQSDPDQLHKNMNQENLIILCQLADQTDNEITLQIIGSLVSTYIDQNHQQIVDFAKIFEFAWNRIRRFTNQGLPVFHFFASIIANIMLHFYDQIPALYFKEQANFPNKQVFLIIVDTVIRRLNQKGGDFKLLDSKQRIVRQQFFKHNLDVLLGLITLSLNTPELIDGAINLLNLLLTSEIHSDFREKDWHKIKRADIKNTRNMQTIFRDIKFRILENDVVELMMQNSHLEHLDPVTSQIKKIWSIIRSQQFIGRLTELLPLNIKIWESLGKICKIYQKYYPHDAQCIQIVQQITQKIMITETTKINVKNLLIFASKTLFLDNSSPWIEFNLSIIKNLSTIDHISAGLKFLRNLARFSRQYDYSQLHTFIMPIIAGFFNQWVVINNTWQQDVQLKNNINHIHKELSCFMIEQYLELFGQAMQMKFQEQAFEYYYMGLFASIKATTYQLDVVNKLQFYKMEQFFYPINLDLFKRFNYQDLYAKALDFAFIYISKQGPSGNLFYYKFWKSLFNPEVLIKFEDILIKMQTDRKVLFNFSRIFQFTDQQLVEKSLQLFLNTKIRIEESCYVINQINIPKDCFNDFISFRMISNPKIMNYYHALKAYLLNVQNESLKDQLVSDILISEFKNELIVFLDQVTNPSDIVLILRSVLTAHARSVYNSVMQVIEEKQFLKKLGQNVNYDLIKLTRVLINTQGQIGQLRQTMVDELLEWIFFLTQKVLFHLEQQNQSFNQERQLGLKNVQNIYNLYYKPILLLLKVFVNFKFTNRLMTSKRDLRIQIYLQILRLFKFININDLSNYIHKMSSLFYVIQWILEFENSRNLITEEVFGQILEFINCALMIQEKRTLATALKIIQDIQTYDVFHHSQFVLQRLIAENCLFGAFLYNLRIQDISLLMLKYFIKMPNDFQLLFTKLKSRMLPFKSVRWEQLYNEKVEKVYSSIPKNHQLTKLNQLNKQAEKTFTDFFIQLQLFYNYYP